MRHVSKILRERPRCWIARRDFALAPDGSLWVALQDGVALHFLPDPDDPSRGIWLSYTTANGLGREFIHLIAVAPDGALWLGYDEGIVERCVEAP